MILLTGIAGQELCVNEDMITSIVANTPEGTEHAVVYLADGSHIVVKDSLAYILLQIGRKEKINRRSQYAIAALEGLLSDRGAVSIKSVQESHAKLAYAYADAMIDAE